MTGRTAAIVAAAGLGLRLGADRPKAMVELAGVPLFMRSMQTMQAAAAVDLVVVAVAAADVSNVAQQCGERVVVVAGGATRHETVQRALAALPDDVDVVLVHDAARALTPVGLVQVVADRVRAGADAVVPALRVVDTIKQVVHDDIDGAEMNGTGERVQTTVDRARLRAVQTPQGFRRSVLQDAYDRCGDLHTDDAGVVEAAGGTVVVVPGAAEAFKITTPLDLLLAEAILRRDSERWSSA